MIPIHIETERLFLRPPTVEDAEAVYSGWAKDPEVTRYLTWMPHSDVEATREYLAQTIGNRNSTSSRLWFVEQKSDQRLLGGIHLNHQGHRAEIGYCLARAAWGKGYMTEVVCSVINAAFAVPEIHRVWATCDLENTASARVLEKAGMSREGVLRCWSVLPNLSREPRDSVCYARVR